MGLKSTGKSCTKTDERLCSQVFERQSQFPRYTHFGAASALVVLLVMNFGVLLGFDWLFSQEYDLLILRIKFSRGWGLIWAEHGHVISIAGVLAYVVCYLISPSHGDNELGASVTFTHDHLWTFGFGCRR